MPEPQLWLPPHSWGSLNNRNFIGWCPPASLQNSSCCALQNEKGRLGFACPWAGYVDCGYSGFKLHPALRCGETLQVVIQAWLEKNPAECLVIPSKSRNDVPPFSALFHIWQWENVHIPHFCLAKLSRGQVFQVVMSQLTRMWVQIKQLHSHCKVVP